jgi:MHS family proline/betaine transporter-like MFS transporter
MPVIGFVSGRSPSSATWLVERTGDEVMPAFLIMAPALISFLFILRMPETSRTPFALGSLQTSTFTQSSPR